jgi:hypothetical protein
MICSGLCRFFGIESLLALHGLLELSYHMDQVLGSRPGRIRQYIREQESIEDRQGKLNLD